MIHNYNIHKKWLKTGKFQNLMNNHDINKNGSHRIDTFSSSSFFFLLNGN